MMPQQLDPVRLALALQELGVTPQALQAIRSAPPDRARMLLDELKLVAKSRYRKFVFELHPDRTQGDPQKTEKLTFLSQVIKQIEAMEYRASAQSVRPQAPPPPPNRGAIQEAAFRQAGSPSIYARGGVPGVPPANIKGPRGVHVVFLRPT